MDTEQYTKIQSLVQKEIQDALQRFTAERQFDVAKIPAHQHNGTDSQQITFIKSMSDTPKTYSGQAGKVPTVNSTENALEFQGSSSSPGGSDTDIQFNNMGSFGGDSNFTWDTTNKVLTINTLNYGIKIEDNVSGGVNIVSTIPNASIGLVGGDGTVSFDPGNVNLFAGADGGTGKGGSTGLFGGLGQGTIGGDVYIFGGGTNDGNQDKYGDVVVLTTHLATGAVSGFLWIPGIQGTPTGVPSYVSGGSSFPICFDEANNKLWIYNGAAWKSTTLT